MPQLTSEEINLLLEAVETWKEMMPVDGHELAEMMSGVLLGDKEQIKAAMTNVHEEARRKRILRKEQGILIQAKLIQIRDSRDVNEAAEFLKKGDQ